MDEGELPEGQVTWTSSRDGLLGTGPDLAVETLSVGVHTITLRADDGQGGAASDTLTLTVVDSPALLPLRRTHSWRGRQACYWRRRKVR